MFNPNGAASTSVEPGEPDYENNIYFKVLRAMPDMRVLDK